MTSQNCVFCKIAKGEIPSIKIWEDEKHLAFLDINPYSKGHTLVIPKEHCEWVWDIDDESYKEYIMAVKYLAEVLRKAFETDWIEEVIAGIGVSHAHVHLLPRQRDDGLGELPTKPLYPKPPAKEELNKIAEKILTKTK